MGHSWQALRHWYESGLPCRHSGPHTRHSRGGGNPEGWRDTVRLASQVRLTRRPIFIPSCAGASWDERPVRKYPPESPLPRRPEPRCGDGIVARGLFTARAGASVHPFCTAGGIQGSSPDWLALGRLGFGNPTRCKSLPDQLVRHRIVPSAQTDFRASVFF